MVSKLERFIRGYAAELKDNGYPAKAAVLRALVESYREDGMPEVFPEDVVRTKPDMERDTRERVQKLIEGRKRLVEALSAVKAEPSSKRVWTSQLAEKINQEAGQYLEDEVQIRDLVVPTKEEYVRKKFDTSQGFGRVREVDEKTLVAYNSALRTLLRAGFNTLGKLRDTDDISKSLQQRVGNLPLATFDLVKAAFARPQQLEREV